MVPGGAGIPGLHDFSLNSETSDCRYRLTMTVSLAHKLNAGSGEQRLLRLDRRRYPFKGWPKS